MNMKNTPQKKKYRRKIYNWLLDYIESREAYTTKRTTFVKLEGWKYNLFSYGICMSYFILIIYGSVML